MARGRPRRMRGRRPRAVRSALLDLVMPGLSATEVLDKIRGTRPQLRVLMASGYTADTNVGELLRSSELQLLSKPYDPDALLRAVRRVLDPG